jgi:hypothetical protein
MNLEEYDRYVAKAREVGNARNSQRSLELLGRDNTIAAPVSDALY